MNFYVLYLSNTLWAATSEKLLQTCAQWRFRSACAFMQSDQKLHWVHFGYPRMQNFFMGSKETLIRLGLICFAADKVYYTAMEGTSCCWYKMVLVEYTRPGNEGVNSYEARNSTRFVWICITPNKALFFTQLALFFSCNVVRCGEGVVYLTSLGRPTGIGLQLGKACYPCSR